VNEILIVPFLFYLLFYFVYKWPMGYGRYGPLTTGRLEQPEPDSFPLSLSLDFLLICYALAKPVSVKSG
jgi:hypothetical protein